ncbi:MAG: discoidin domain-containing protein, partial [Methanococcaceae archaeon]
MMKKVISAGLIIGMGAVLGFVSDVHGQSDITNLRGAVSAQYNEVPEWPISKVIDNASASKYLTKHNSVWIQYLAPGLYTVTKYSVTNGNDAANQDPKNWTLRASLDGVNWKGIDVQSNVSFSDRMLKKTFTIVNSVPYQFYRLELSNGTSGTAKPNVIEIAEWELFGTQVADSSTTAPAAPGNLTAMTNSSAQIDLTWEDNSNNETYFRVERS